MKEIIAIQGVKGAFHEEAAIHLLGNGIEIIPCITFEELVEKVSAGSVPKGFVAIENTISGTIINNLELIRRNKLKISHEIRLRIKQNLCVIPGSTVALLNEVHSHYMALNQCLHFFEEYKHIKLIPSVDTALSMKDIAESRDITKGAIGSILAAKYYGLEILASSIETYKQNYTRFVVITRNEPILPDYNKVSIAVTINSQTGSFTNMINLFHQQHINITKIDALPIPGKPWEYRYYLDYLYPEEAANDLLFEHLKIITDEVMVLGMYKHNPIIYGN